MDQDYRVGPGVRVHETAIIEPGVTIGAGTAVWDHVHIRHHSSIGSDSIVGEKTYIAYDVQIGNRVKINAHVYICTQVIIEDWVMIAAGTVFTNDRFPRAVNPETGELITSEPTDETLTTVVRRGVTIGANATIGPGIEIGEFAMVGMGAVVTRSVAPYALVVGNPARCRGYICQCGKPVYSIREDHAASGLTEPLSLTCSACGKAYLFSPPDQFRPVTS